jgi:hypothetical protein
MALGPSALRAHRCLGPAARDFDREVVDAGSVVREEKKHVGIEEPTERIPHHRCVAVDGASRDHLNGLYEASTRSGGCLPTAEREVEGAGQHQLNSFSAHRNN